jgi:transcriptional regulator with XRE-family HTH domain
VTQASTTPEPEPSVGPRLRDLRRQRGLSLQQVALATGISKSFLSLVENGTNDIAFGRLRRLIDLYGVDLADLVPPAAVAEEAVVRANGRRRFYSPAEGIDIYLATPGTRHDLLAGVAVMGGGAMMPDESRHTGEEWVHVVAGVVQVDLDGGATSVRLGAGDSVYLRAGRSHRFSNPGDETAQVITVLSQGGRWDSAPQL